MHVNEGLVEWPPSPWRLLRSLLATWHLKARDEIPEPTMRQLVETLSATLPEFELPTAITTAHSRHYMPQYDGKTTKVFDTFVRLQRDDALRIRWPIDGEVAEGVHEALATLVGRLGYLGRAESWVEGNVTSATDWKANAVPLTPEQTLDWDYEPTSLLAAVPPADHHRWRAAALDERITRKLDEKRRRAREKGKSPDQEKLSAADRRKLEASLPEDVFAALQVDTAELHKAGWSRPPGSRWVTYARPRNALQPPTRPATGSKTRPDPTVARFAVSGPVRPRLTEGLRFSETLRGRLLKRSHDAPVFSGHDAEGTPLDGHRHAFILPEATGDQGRISHVTVHAPMGLDANARRALSELGTLPIKGGHSLKFVLLGLGEGDEFAGCDLRAGQCPLLSSSRVWVSRTPFVPTRHGKTDRKGRPKLDSRGLQIDGPDYDVLRLLAENYGLETDRIDRVSSTSLSGKATRWLKFRTLRHHGGGRRGSVRGFGFRLEFPHPVAGPLVLGYGAHFGLGQFVPEGVFD
jgi:CRISPR-associated protein Csb2